MKKTENTRYAENELGEIIEAIKGMNTNQDFTCLGCQEPLSASAIHTKIQSAHFRHINNNNTSGGCGSFESYIHNFSKRKFEENYKYTSQFLLKQTLNIRCIQSKYQSCTSRMNDVINLKERYPHIKLEKKDGDFRPDCLIYNDAGDKIYIEIKYKSPVSQKKIDSGIPIIEIEVNNEEEIKTIIENGFIDMSLANTRLINFEEVSPNSIYDCQNNCPQDALNIAEKEAKERAKEDREQKTRKEKEQEEKVIALKKKKSIKENKQSIFDTHQKWEEQIIQNKPKIIENKTVQLFRPKKCFSCPSNPIHYMNVGRIIVDEEYRIISVSIKEHRFKDEIESSLEFSIAKRKENGETNAYYCPNCGSWIANNRLLGKPAHVYIEENIIIC